MTEPRDIAAVFFDMDGTLIDSELNTEPAITSVCRELGLPDPALDYTAFYGWTWSSVVDAMVETEPAVADIPDLALRFHQAFHHLCLTRPSPPIAGAEDIIAAFSARIPVAIVSSAYRESIEATIMQLDIGDLISCYVGAEDFERSKPAPDCFLHAAKLLDVEPSSCLVFEDSIAGLGAARAAGMWAVAITHRSNDIEGAPQLGHLAIDNYTLLDEGFVARACRTSQQADQ